MNPDDGPGDDTNPQPDTYIGYQKVAIDTGMFWSLLTAPWDGRKDAVTQKFSGPAFASTTTLVALVLEFLWSFVFGVVVVSARFATTLGTASNGLQDGFFIGAIAASTWLLAWIWSTDYNLKRHLNWAFTIAGLFTFRIDERKRADGTTFNGGVKLQANYGLLAFALYGGVQLAGAALAGAFLLAFGMGSIPNPSPLSLDAANILGSAITAAQSPPALLGTQVVAAGAGLMWFIEFFGVFIIVLANSYTDLRHQDKSNSSGKGTENEYDNHIRTGVITALAIVVMTTAFYPLGSYSFGNVPYFAGLVAVGTSTASSNVVGAVAGDSSGTLLIDYAHYLFTPLAGGFAGGVLACLVSILLQLKSERGEAGMRGNFRVLEQKYRSVQTPLTQKLLSTNQQQAAKTGLRSRSAGAAGGASALLPVNSFE